MNVDRLRELVESVLNGGGDVSERLEGVLRVTVGLQLAGGAATTSIPSGENTIVSNVSGQLHLQGEPGAPPYVQLGQTVEAGQRLALLEAMKTFCPVVSTRAGQIVEIMVEHGAEVAAGQPLFRVA